MGHSWRNIIPCHQSVVRSPPRHRDGTTPLLIYINDLASNVSPGTTVRLSVDDCLVYREITCEEDQLTFQKDLAALQAAIPLKSIPMSRHLPEMPAECQTMQMCLPLTALALHWHSTIVLTLTACFRDHDDITESALTHVIENPKVKYRVLYWHHCYDAGC